MEDRFKFRVWQGEGQNLQCAYHQAMTVAYADSNLRAAIIEQCTGLKDRNGKLIYEGDIIRFFEGNSNVFKVYLSNWFAGWRRTMPGREGRLSIDIEHHVVIGNIHENPELLATP